MKKTARKSDTKMRGEAAALAREYFALHGEFSARLKRAPKDFAALRKAALKHVKAWHWFSLPAASLSPVFFLFELNQRGTTNKPGRKIRGEPKPVRDEAGYGMDAAGAIHVIKSGPDQLELWQHSPGRIDSTRYVAGKPVLLQSLWLKDGRPHVHVFYNQHVMTIKIFVPDGVDRVGYAQSYGFHGGRRKLEFEILDAAESGKLPGWIEATLPGGGIVNRYELAAKTKPKTPLPVLDLRADLPAIEDFITAAAAAFAKKHRSTAITGIGLEFRYYGPGAALWINFDTREDFDVDGEWSHFEFASLKRPQWDKFDEAVHAAGEFGVLIDADGGRHSLNGEQEPARWFGRMLVGLLQKNKRKFFQPLLKTHRCELVVEDGGDGAFGWPRYQDRGKENLV